MPDLLIPNRDVLALLETAVQAISAQLDSRNPVPQERALRALQEAKSPADQNALVLFYRSILADLLGQYEDAAHSLRRLMNEALLKDTRWFEQIINNLHVVDYQVLRRQAVLHPAEEKYKEEIRNALAKVFPNNDDESSVAHRDALYARFLALTCRPAQDTELKTPANQERIERNYQEATILAGKVLERAASAPRRELNAGRTRQRWKEAIAVAYLARGRARLYYTDLLENSPSKSRLLEDVKQDLTRAYQSFPDDYTYVCDLGSYYLRSGHSLRDGESSAGRAEPEFERARLLFERVLKELRPNYGFALFELGRVFRLWGRQEQALNYLRAAMAIEEARRGITNDRVANQIELAEKNDTSTFP